MYKPDYAFEGQPATGETMAVAPGVAWLRMPLPFKLDHINLWLLDDGDGWTLVDTGIDSDDVRDAWQQIEQLRFADKPPKRLIVTHFHPDHVGLAGWLAERFDIPLWMPLGEWTQGRMHSLDTAETIGDSYRRFYKSAGFDETMLDAVEKRMGRYGQSISPIPAHFHRISHGDNIQVGDYHWRVIVGTGHAPEHACLYCEQLGVLISGDQVLPRISPNVSVWPQEPDANPLQQFLASLDNFRDLPEDSLVLPSHDWPFRGLHGRLDDLAGHHRDRLDETEGLCAEPATGVEVLRGLFKRELDNHQLFFAIGESLAHLHHLASEGRVERRVDGEGVYRFQRRRAA